MAGTLFFAIYCLEAGFFFTILPWTRLWTTNPLLHGNVAIGAMADNPFVRGFVSGIGVLHLLLAAREFLQILRARENEPR